MSYTPLPSPATPSRRRLTPMTLLRVYLGVGLMIKGIYYITNMAQLESQLGDGFGQTQNLIAWFVVAVHGVGGAALALGFVTRWVASLNAVVLLGAAGIHLMGSDLLAVENNDFQFAMLVLVTLIVFIWQGAGRFSLDRLMWGEEAAGAEAVEG